MPGRPKYNPEEVAALVLEGRLTSNMTVTNYLVNRDYDVRDLTTELLTALSEHGSYIGSPRLKDGGIQLVVLVSCWWDGTVH